MIRRAAQRMKEILGLTSEPVAVFLLPPGAASPTFDNSASVTGHRYCQLLMRARHGESLRLDPHELACPAASAAFGFRTLPENLATGKGLVAFGIVAEPATGKTMFEGMTRLPAGSLGGIAVCPLAAAPALPDVVVVEAPPEQLMWLALADLNLAGGKRRRGDTAVLQATCVDATVIPYVEKRLNFSLGCYGCREATDLHPHEAIAGFPGTLLESLVDVLDYLAAKAISRSRTKAVWHHFEKKMKSGKDDQQIAEGVSRPATAVGVLPRLEKDLVVALSAHDVMRVFSVIMDRDSNEALEFIERRLYKAVKKAIETPHCVPVFEMGQKTKDGV